MIIKLAQATASKAPKARHIPAWGEAPWLVDPNRIRGLKARPIRPGHECSVPQDLCRTCLIKLENHLSVIAFCGATNAGAAAHTSFARLAVRAGLGGGSRSLGLDVFSSGNRPCKAALSSDL